MKTFLVSLYGTFFLFLNTSKTDNFYIEDSQVIWQKVYTTELSKEQLITEIRNSGYFNNTSLHGDTMTAEISELYLDFKGYGDKTKLPRLGARYMKSYVIIDFKKEKYRITIKNMRFRPIVTGGDSYDRTIHLEEVALQKEADSFKEKFLKNTSKVMDFTFQKITDFKESEDNDNW